MRRLRILTWHVHGSYLAALGQLPHEIVVPYQDGELAGYAGLPAGGHVWGRALRQVPAKQITELEIDCVLYQGERNWRRDRFELLDETQRALPAIYLEHDPPRASPTDTLHPAADSDVLLVHVTPFNELMWDSGATPTRVIEHGVPIPDARYSGELARGLVVVNEIGRRGRRLGVDVLERVREQVPIDLVGMGSRELGGLGEVPHRLLPAFAARYRFLFNPIRYTSLGLAVCEAMAIGMPIVGLATTEMATAVHNGVSGYVDTRVDVLIERMQQLLDDPALARQLGEAARETALGRFGHQRFLADWCRALEDVTARGPAPAAGLAGTLVSS